MDKMFIVIEHINGEIEDLWVIKGIDYATHCSKIGYLVYELNPIDLTVKEIEL